MYNNFFFINKMYYLYIYLNKYKYNIKIIDNTLYIFIITNILKHDYLKIKIINSHNNTECIKTLKIMSKQIKVCNMEQLSNTHNNNLHNFEKFTLKGNFDIKYYVENNNLLGHGCGAGGASDEKFIFYHWLNCGRFDSYIYFKYLLHKYKDIILKLDISHYKYSENNNNTLLFIDNRHDPSFIYILILFIYSIDSTWNLTIFTTTQKRKMYENDLKQLNITGKFIILDEIKDYSQLLSDKNFWKKIKEENCLLFQYDSIAMGKFDNIFYNYTYIGAIWGHSPTIYANNHIGNGGTCFRKTRVMEYICGKYKNINQPEDVFFSEKLYAEKLHNCPVNIAKKFSFENVFNAYSIYGHQIYNSVKRNNLDAFIYKRLSRLVV